jgi:hypothetical protein
MFRDENEHFETAPEDPVSMSLKRSIKSRRPVGVNKKGLFDELELLFIF